MFSPEASVLGARSSLRNPRRRQRKDSDGVQLPRRKRNKLGDDTLHLNGDALTNGNGSAIAKSHVNLDDADGSMVLVDMPVREKKAVSKRVLKDDVGQYLTKNENYNVKKLPSFPSQLTQLNTPFRAFALLAAGLAVAFTSRTALVWDYTTAAGARIVTLPLPFDLKPSEPLPLGAIVRNGPSNEFGILAIAPSRGKIMFWENVDSAEVRSQYAQQPQGIQGSVKMYSGEVITNLVDIEHAGYVLVFSSGRMAQLTLRDSQGRPSITTNILRAPNGSGGSFFSFSGLLGGGSKKSIASVKARSSASKGQMEVITVTKTGLFQVWDLSWSGQQMFKAEVDVHALVLGTLQSGTPPEARGQQDARILDFAILGERQEPGVTALLMLVALTGLGSTDYALLELDLTQDSAIIRRAIPIRNLQQESTVHDLAGSLLLPGPQHTAFIQFPGAIVIASLAEPEESPNTQLELDSGRPAFPYQDTIYLRKESHDAICGSASEVSTKKDRHACALMFIRGCGVIQISALPPAGEDAALDRCKVTAKSKLEQATFFSTHPDNIIDFSIKSRYTFDDDEVEQAAVQISTDILSSSYDQIDSVTSSVEDQIRQRAMALRTLRAYLQAEFDHSPLSTQGKWHLLSQAEKVAAAAEIWKDYQKKVSDKELRPEKYPESLLLPHMVKCLHEKWKTVIRPELGETDPVRQFFIKDLNRLEILIPWAWMTLRTFYLNHNNGKDRAAIMQRISEGNDIIITALQTAFKFREENCQDYGLDPDELSFGVLKPNNGQEFIPNFWTSTHNMVATIRSLTDVGRNYAYETFEQGVHEEIAMKIAKDNPLLVDLGLKTHIERFTWALAQDDPKLQETGKHLQQEFIKTVRPEHIYGLANIGMADAGMNLAESYNDLGTLAHLIWDETIYLERSKENTQSKVEHAECVNKLKRIKDRIQRYFDKFGDSWASAFYRRYIKEGRSERLFHKEYLNQPALTKFLRTNPSVARLSWINEISGERDYGKAHDTLVEVAMSQETNGWCKKVELSLAKLSMLAKIEQQSEPTAKDAAKLAETVSRQEYVKIQDRLYERIAPTLEEALDDESAIGLLMDEFGKGRLVDRPAHQQLLRQGFEDLVNHRVLDPALLIDILTLMTYDESKPPVEIIQSNEFAFALKALVLSWQDMNKTTRVNTLRLIWKRVCIADNWAEINNTKEITSDVKLEELLAQTALGRTFHTLLQMINKDRKNAVAWPKFDIDKLFGAGCTNGELCTRFGSEDLRNPIIADNVADDEVLQENIQKHRLDEWFRKVMQYAMKRVDEEQKQGSAESMDGGPVGGELVQGDETLGDVEMADA